MKHRARALKARRPTRNGYIDIVSPATALEIRETLGIRARQVQNVRRALRSAGVKI